MKKKKAKDTTQVKTQNDVKQVTMYFLIALFAVFTALISNSKLSGEDDLFWYLSTGRLVVQTGTFPSTDVFGYSTQGQPWIPFEWGWDVINYIIYSGLGFTGLSLFATLIILLIFYLQYNLMTKLNVNETVSVIFMILMIFGMMPRLTIKPHLITYLFLSLVLTIIVYHNYLKKSDKILYFLPAIFLLWINMHMGIMSGLLTLGLYVIYKIINFFITGRKEADKKGLLMLIIISAASTLITLINPHGWNTYLYSFHIVSMQQLDIIYEWVSPFNQINQGQVFIYVYYLFLAGALAVIYYSYTVKDYLPTLITLGFILHSIRATRLTVDYILASAAFIAMTTWYYLKGKKEGNIFETNAARAVIIVILLFFIVMIPGNRLYRAMKSPRIFGTGLDQYNFPVKMFDVLAKSRTPATGERPFNTYETGGYFAWCFPGKMNFIGGRGINDQVWNDYTAIINMKDGFEELMKKYDFDYVVWFVPFVNFYDNPDILQRTILSYFSANNGQWRAIYWDDNSIAYVKDDPKFDKQMIEYGYAYMTPYNFYFNKDFLEKASIVDKQLMRKEIEKNLTEEPNGRVINAIKREWYDRLK